MVTTQAAQHNPIQGVARVLVMDGIMDETRAREHLQKAQATHRPFVQYLVEESLIPAQEVAAISSRNFGVPFLDINAYDTELMPIDTVSEKLIQKHHVLPLYQRGNQLFIAVADPSRQTALDEIQFHTGLKVTSVVVEADKLTQKIDKTLSEKESAALDTYLEDSALDELSISADDLQEEEDTNPSDDAPIVRFVNKILLDAIKQGASDIHFEPYENQYRVRFRIDGLLHETATPPTHLSGRIASRLKIMAQLDISERRIPQDGRFKMNLSKRHTIDFRISTCPTANGEKIVMRILDPTSATIGIEALGFNKTQKELFEKAIAQPQGMVLVTGPTGSGKTVTLYTALNQLNLPEKNISTAEDPVELKVQGINQVNINTKVGLTFSSALRAFLRQDPDIIMVGEMRDVETAEIAIKAAQTGHLVLSTLHTNSACETLSRLMSMGIEPYNLASSVSLIIAQRLARRLCEHCKTEAEVPEEALLKAGFQKAEAASVKVFQANGCNACTQGYKGRIGLYEMLPVTKTLSALIMQGASVNELETAARREGLLTIHDAGLEKVKQGITTLDEVNRVTKD